jgi:hypothetical protein
MFGFSSSTAIKEAKKRQGHRTSMSNEIFDARRGKKIERKKAQGRKRAEQGKDKKREAEPH